MPEPSSAQLLAWYDIHARDLPWRTPPAARLAGERPDPYRVWLSEIMLQQTTVVTVKDYFRRFTERWPAVEALAAAPREDVLKEWAGLGYYARARNLHACAVAVAERHGGVFPDEESALLDLPGIGPYTAAAIAAIAFDRPAVVVDGNVERVMARLFAIEAPLPGSKPEIRAAAASLTPLERPGDYAQAVMDLGATLCSPRSPACALCPWMSACAGRKAGIAAELPRKSPKKAKPVRHGLAYVVRREDGAVLLDRRPDKGLLGGMTEVPGSDWTEGASPPLPSGAPVRARWRAVGEVRHTFTHFHLILTVMRADVALDARPTRGRWTPGDAAFGEALPTVMKKALRTGLSE